MTIHIVYDPDRILWSILKSNNPNPKGPIEIDLAYCVNDYELEQDGFSDDEDTFITNVGLDYLQFGSEEADRTIQRFSETGPKINVMDYSGNLLTDIKINVTKHRTMSFRAFYAQNFKSIGYNEYTVIAVTN